MLKKKENNVGKEIVMLSFSKIVTMVIAMLSAMLLSRFRSLEEYGTYSQLLMVINLTTSLIMLGLPNSINYFLVRAKSLEEKQKFLSVYYTLSTILSIFIGITLVVSVQFLVSYFNNKLIINFIYFLAIYPWTKIVTSSIENVLVVYNKSNLIMMYRISNSVLLLLIIIISQIFNLSFEAYMKMFILVEMIFSLLVYIIVNKVSGKIKFDININIIKKVLSFSIPIGIATAIGTLNLELDKLVISQFSSVEQLAIFTNAARELPVTIIATSITTVLLPKLTKLIQIKMNKEAIQLWGHSIIVSYYIICFIVVGIFVYAPDVINILYSSKYLDGVPVFRVYSIVLLLRCTYFGIILNSLGKTKLILYNSIVSLILNLVLNYIFYYIFGFIGPAIATLISMVTMCIYQLYISSKLVKISIKEILPWKKIKNITVINIGFGMLFFLIKKFFNLDIIIGEIAETLVLSMIWSIIYIICIRKRIVVHWKSIKGD